MCGKPENRVDIAVREVYNKSMKLVWIFTLLLAVLSGCQLIPGLNPSPTMAPVVPAATSADFPAPTSIASTPTTLPATRTPAQQPSQPAPNPTSGPAGPLVLAPKTLTLENTKPPYEIRIQYPEITPATTPGLQAFNDEAKNLAQGLLASFQKDFDQAQPLPEPSAATGSFMQTGYSVTHGQHGLLSVLFNISFYYSGAAHPNSFAASLNFDLIHGKKLELSEVFLPGTDFLTPLAAACTADLKKRDLLAFPEGALPKAENYKNWNITPQGIQIWFDAYQVAPYVMGPSHVLLTYASLKNLLNAQGPLAVLLQ